MKIAFVDQPIGVLSLPPTGSVTIWIHEVGRRLARQHQVLVYGRRGRRQPAAEQVDGLEVRRLTLARDRRGLGRLARWVERLVPLGPRPYASALYYLGYALAVGWDLRRQNCDIIHIQNFAQFAPVLRALNPRARIVLHMHCAWLTQLDQGLIERRLQAVDLVVGCCDHITDGARRRFPSRASACQTVFNGVETHAQPPSDKTGRQVLFVGRVSPEKGLHVLVDAFRTVADRCPEARLTIVGAHRQLSREYLLSLSDDPAVQALASFYSNGSETSYFEQVRRQIEALGLTERVTFTGAVPHAQTAALYGSADVYVQPSFSEAFPIPVPEAMAAGLPVVATRVGGIPEAVTPGETGLLVEQGDAAGLADALLRVLQDDGLRARLGQAARRRAQAQFDWDSIAQDMLRQYQALLAPPEAARLVSA